MTIQVKLEIRTYYEQYFNIICPTIIIFPINFWELAHYYNFLLVRVKLGL